MARTMTLEMFCGDRGYQSMTYEVGYLYDLVIRNKTTDELCKVPMEMPEDQKGEDWIEVQLECFMDHAMKQAGLHWADWEYEEDYCVKRIYEL